MKSYTDINQSRKLAEILSHNTADQTWQRVAIAGANLDVPDEIQYRHNGDMPFQIYSGIGIPCWSLSALLSILPYPTLAQHANGLWSLTTWVETVKPYSVDGYDNKIDACVEMIIKLHELKLL